MQFFSTYYSGVFAVKAFWNIFFVASGSIVATYMHANGYGLADALSRSGYQIGGIVHAFFQAHGFLGTGCGRAHSVGIDGLIAFTETP